MSATRLLVLGIVRAHPGAHGYIISREMHAIGAEKWANTKNGSIYHALRQLTKESMLEGVEVTSLEGPSRTDYRLTETGETEFQALMQQALGEPATRADMLCAGLSLMTALPRSRIIAYLRARLDILTRHKSNVAAAHSQAEWSGQNAVPQHLETLISFWANYTDSSYNWILSLVDKLESGAYVFAEDTAHA